MIRSLVRTATTLNAVQYAKKLHPRSRRIEGVLRLGTRAFCRLKIFVRMWNKSNNDGGENVTESWIGRAEEGTQRRCEYWNAYGKTVQVRMKKKSQKNWKYLPYDGSCRMEVFGNLWYRRNKSPGDKNWSIIRSVFSDEICYVGWPYAALDQWETQSLRFPFSLLAQSVYRPLHDSNFCMIVVAFLRCLPSRLRETTRRIGGMSSTWLAGTNRSDIRADIT